MNFPMRAEAWDDWRDRVEELLRILAGRRRRRHEHQWALATWWVRHPMNIGVAYWICPCGKFKQVEYAVLDREDKPE